MRRNGGSWMLGVCLGFCSGTLAADEMVLGEHRFQVPDGFEILPVAGPPLVDRPIEIAFDDRGRLYCTDSAGVNDNVQQQLAEKPHRVLRLEDTDGDGIFDSRTVFADQMMFPEGCLWYRGSVYVAAPPSIWKLTDTDDDGVADVREEWFQGETLTGCANDLHGPYLGLDGWIYWTKGAFAEQSYTLPNGNPWTTRAAHIFRARPDGSGIEPVMTGGMDNPVGVAFTPGGERIFTTTFFQHPGGGKRDGLIHAIYGGVYGKVHGVIEGHPRTGDLMPVLSHLGAAAPAGLTRYQSAVFGPEFRDNLFSANFNLQQVMRHRLSPKGATFAAVDEVFVRSDNRNFHPTDVEEDADGSLLIVDTGGWYKLCCPTSQLPKPDVLGAIYRVRRIDATPVGNPRARDWDLTAWGVPEVLARLDDPRPAVGERLIERLGSDDRLLRVMGSFDWARLGAEGRRRLVWALSRHSDSEARTLVRTRFRDDDPVVRRAAIHVASVHRDEAAVDGLSRLLATDIPANRRAAAEALGRIGSPEAVPILLRQLGRSDDAILRHSVIFALIEIGAPEPTRLGLESDVEGVQIGALTALDQMEEAAVPGRHYESALNSSEPSIRRTGRWLVGRHPEGARLAAGSIAAALQDSDSDAFHDPEWLGWLTQLLSDSELAARVPEWFELESVKGPARRLLLQAMSQTSGDVMPVSWSPLLVGLLQAGEAEIVSEAARVAIAWAKREELDKSLLRELLRLALDTDGSAMGRLGATAALMPRIPTLRHPQWELVLGSVAVENALAQRALAASILAQATLTQQQLLQLARQLPAVGPLELPDCLVPFGQSSADRIGNDLIRGLSESPGQMAVTPVLLQATTKDYPVAVRSAVEAYLAGRDEDLTAKRERLESLLAELPKGDVRRGQAVFNSPKAACVSCHEIGYLGGDVGPDLTRIGRVRSREDLLEALLYPSMSFVRSYEPYQVVTRDGEQYSGVIRNDDGTVLTLVTGPGASVQLRHADIVEQSRGQVSLMPGGLVDLLSEQELGDLLAFLEATQW